MHLARVISAIGGALHLPLVVIQPKFNELLFTALADVETQGGEWNLPRFEKSWFDRLTSQDRQGPPHGYARFADWIAAYGKQVASSWGPWQLMAFNAYDRGYRGRPDLLSLPEVAAIWTALFFNSLPLTAYLSKDMRLHHKKEKPDDAVRVDLRTLSQVRYDDRLTVLAVVGDAWNTGNAADANVPETYIKRLTCAYLKREEEAK